MLGFSRLFISPAWAQTMDLAQHDSGGDVALCFGKYVPIAIVFAIVYFLFMHKKKR